MTRSVQLIIVYVGIFVTRIFRHGLEYLHFPRLYHNNIAELIANILVDSLLYSVVVSCIFLFCWTLWIQLLQELETRFEAKQHAEPKVTERVSDADDTTSSSSSTCKQQQ